jgi:LysR family positive regulator for ilvC
MDHKQLKYFLALAETLHFGRASEQCHISAPTLSRQIKQLEAELNIALFIRDNRSVMLTAQGKAFVEYARSTLTQWRQFKSECLDSSQPLSGELSFYCSVTATYSFVYDLLAKFRQQHPAIELNLNTGDPALSITHILTDKEDLAVAVKPAQLPQNLSYLPIGQTNLVIVAPILACPLTELLSSQNEHDIQWCRLPFIMPEQGILKERLDNFCKRQEFTPQVYAHVSGHEAMVALASLGFGVACIPEIVIAQSPLKDQVRYISAPDLIDPIEIGLVCKTKRLTDPIVMALWETAENLFCL